MQSINHILLASDLTEQSQAALQRAAQLKVQLAARLTVLHVVDPGLPQDLSARRRRDAVDVLERQKRPPKKPPGTRAGDLELPMPVARKDVWASGGSLELSSPPRAPRSATASIGKIVDAESRRVSLEVVVGEPFATIVEETEARGAGLIVLGDTKKRRWKELFLGTTVERVLRMSGQPVLVAGDRGDRPYQRLLVAFDASPGARRALQTALTIAREAECRIICATQAPLLSRQAGDALAAKLTDSLRGALNEEMKRAGPMHARPDIQIVEGNAHFVIRDHLKAFAPDLLAMGTHARGSTATAMLAGFAQDLVTDAHRDVLIAASDRA